MKNWHCTIRDMSKYDLIRLIESYDRYLQELYDNDDYTGSPKCIEDFMDEDCAELEL